ncbi:heparan-alpha-glucosaminide N-acetyltransferase domain-containing protein [Arthrobacter sp.]|uniref:heparan-alpha-glucosaminide N-acetyltransferase domain-containing protein n=1 Tax=Arthrobacter sp. TaxID=1667 RepID=UPI003A900970
MPRQRTTAPTRRVAGVDVARGLALLGMMGTHIMPLTLTGSHGTEATWVALLFAGKASAVFAILAGVGLGLLTGGSTPHSGARLGSDRRSVAVRALLITAIGLAAGSLDTNVAVILVHYGLLFLIASAFLGLRLRTLWCISTGWLLLAPALWYLLLPWVQTHVEPATAGASPGLGDVLRPATLLADLFVTGYYPVLVWTGFVLLGLAVGRCRLQLPPVALAFTLGGAALAVGARMLSDQLLASHPGAVQALGAITRDNGLPLDAALASGRGLAGIEATPWWFAISAPHSSAPLDLLHVAGTALAVLGVCQLVAMALAALLGGVGEALLWPLSGAGSATLTLYTGHLVALDLLGTATAGMPRLGLYLWFVVVALLVGIALKWAGRRGPLEAAVHTLSEAAAGRSASTAH